MKSVTVTLRRLAVVVLALLPCAASSQIEEREIPLASLYDLDSTSYIYCVTTGANGQVLNNGTNNFVRVTSSTTTLAAVTALTSPFTSVAVGDEVTVVVSGIARTRVITAKASDDSVTMNAGFVDATGTAVNVTNVQFTYRDRTCGTAATDGWFPVSTYRGANVSLQVTQISVTGQIEFIIQCRKSGVDDSPIDVYAEGMTAYRPGGYNAAQVDNDEIILHNGVVLFNMCRVGMLIDSADDGSDTGVDAEQVTVKLLLSRF